MVAELLYQPTATTFSAPACWAAVYVTVTAVWGVCGTAKFPCRNWMGADATLLTVSGTAALVVVRFEVSRATAVSVWAPFEEPVVFQVTENGEVPVTSEPRFATSSLNCTPATPALSLAVALTVIVPLTVAPAAGAVIATVGGVVCDTLFTVTGTAALVVVRLAVSRATAVRLWPPLPAPVV